VTNRDEDHRHGEAVPQKPIDYGNSPESVEYPEKPITYGDSRDREESPEHQWVGPESNPAAAGDDDPNADWIGPESNPASGNSDE
jgi:hypothetical protein